MDLKGSEFNIRLFTHELERYQRQTKDNNQPSDIASSVLAIKENLVSLKVETRKLASGYIKANLVDKAKSLMESFQSKYSEAKTFVRNVNVKLSNLGTDRLSSIDSLSCTDLELPHVHVDSPKHHNVYHSKPVEDDEGPAEPLPPPSQRSRTSQRAPVATRQVLEEREQVAKKELLNALRIPRGLSHELTLKIQKYINFIKDQFLVYKDVYLDLKSFLFSHGCTEEHERVKGKYFDLMQESNHLIQKLNDILEDRNEEVGSILGSVSPGDRDEVGSCAPSIRDDLVDIHGLPTETVPAGTSTNLGAIQKRANVAVEGGGRMKLPNGRVSFGPTTVGLHRDHYDVRRSRSSSSEGSDLFNRGRNPSSKYDVKTATPCEGTHDIFGNRRTGYDCIHPAARPPGFDSRTAYPNTSCAEDLRVLGRSRQQVGGDSDRKYADYSRARESPRRENYGYREHRRLVDTTRSNNSKWAFNELHSVHDPDVNSVVRGQVRSDLYRGIMDPFSGSPERFWSWKMQLVSHLREASCSAADTIHIILRNTSGKPKAIVQEYLNSCCEDPEVTLQEVWRELERRFGSNSLVSRCLLDRIHNFESIQSAGDVNEMEKLLGICRSARSKMKTCRQLEVLNYQSEMRNIWEKMPPTFQTQWQKKFIRIERRTGDAPTIDHLFESIADFIDQNSHPDFSSHTKVSKSKTVKVLHTTVSPQIVRDLHCLYHNETGHDLTSCHQFGRLGWSAKRTHATEWKLCFNCLQPHYASQCPKTSRCGICGGSHIDVMHRSHVGKFATSIAEPPHAPTNAWTPTGQSKPVSQGYNHPPPPIGNGPHAN